MNLELIYVIVSALLLTFAASLWSSRGGINISIKLALVLTAFGGAVAAARMLAL